MTTATTDSRRARYAVPDGPDLFLSGYRGHDLTARFSLWTIDGALLDNADWPTALRSVMPVVRDYADAEAFLRSALPPVVYDAR